MGTKIQTSQLTPSGKRNSFNKFIWITSIFFLGLFGFEKSSWAADRFIDKNAPCARGTTCNGLT